jgi:hypothetical protein
MQITINVPDNLPKSFVLKEIKAFEEKLRKAHDNAKEIVEDDELKINVQACFTRSHAPRGNAVDPRLR